MVRFVLGLGLVALQATVLFQMGQPEICACGHVKLWEEAVLSSGNSQHLTDWYTYSHVIHGFLFYLALWLMFPRVPIGTRLLIALGTEITWELIENSPFVIDRYREQALAAGYVGDSIINSLSDTCAMIVGFVIAWRAPVWLTIMTGVTLEVLAGYSIRDNLTLNVLNLIHQFPAISRWQSGGH